MTDEHKLRQQAERGDRARQILDDELFQEAFASVEKIIEDGWKDSAADDHKARENAYLMHRLLKNLRQQFTSKIATGEDAKRKLIEVKDPKLRIFRHV